MTTRERKERRAERLRGWAEKREAKAAATLGGVATLADAIPLGQPILVGHHSERHARRDQERIRAGMERGLEHQRKAAAMAARASGIEAQLDRSIYSDDPDALERLEEKLVALEADREKKAAINRAYWRGDAAFAEATGVSVESAARMREQIEAEPYSTERRPFPRYVLANLGSEIRRLRKRIEALRGGEVRP